MAEYLIQGDTLTDIADAIRSKIGSTASIKVSNMASVIAGLSSSSSNIEASSFEVSSTTNVINFTCAIDPSILILRGPTPTEDSDVFVVIYNATDGNNGRFSMYYYTADSVKYYGVSGNSPTADDPYVWIRDSGISVMVGIKSDLGLNFTKGTWNYIAIE